MATQPLPAAEQVPVSIPHVNRILVPIDFSDSSLTALNRAIAVAKIYHSSIVLVHVIAHHASTGMANVLHGALTQLELDLQTDLDDLCQRAIGNGVPCTALLRQGSVIDDIHEVLAADEINQKIDLLILATHVGTGLHGVFLGSTTERLIRSVTIPVLTIGCAQHQPDWDDQPARHVLFAGDFSRETLCGLSLALGIQQTTGAQLSVVEAVPFGTWPDILSVIRLRIGGLVPPGTGIHTPEGPTSRTVCQLARRIGASLIVLGIHRSTHVRNVFGSGLIETLLNSPCPVLTVRQCSD
jgi:nucleotide-binding universal stress UspA family protein